MLIIMKKGAAETALDQVKELHNRVLFCLVPSLLTSNVGKTLEHPLPVSVGLTVSDGPHLHCEIKEDLPAIGQFRTGWTGSGMPTLKLA